MLFRRAVADAVPLPPPIARTLRARAPSRSRVSACATSSRSWSTALADPWDWEAAVSTGEELFFSRPGVPAAALRKLRRGGWVIQGELDLHGHTGDEARIALAAFLNRCMIEDRRCVRIIHGKGLRLEKPPAGAEKQGAPLADAARGRARLLPGAQRRRRRRGRHRAAQILIPLNMKKAPP